ncbi:Golgi-associated plant pathogenesis-related protein 1 [Stylophora pistillata]|uniref:Golgi-associated plant pathogenesis-related protein 1 n=2 Tax=Stylophora pistillata TaxID=50429 RepID=A0A2B4S8R2_STYPI|nr:Golgi-associated plant pathogenesis-related protein 1 [Stylophora pistillata]
MILTLSVLFVFSRSGVEASLSYGNMKIEGTGNISPNYTSVDIHFEIANVEKSQPYTPTRFGMKPKALPIAVRPRVHTTVPFSFKDTWYHKEKPSFGVETEREFLKSALESHNRFRAIHNSPPLRINIKMLREAEQFAKKLLQRGVKKQPMVHEDVLVLRKEDEGENLASGGSVLGGLTAYGAVKNWYNEVCTYNWGKGGYEPQAAHFMQVIWKNSTEFGIGKAERRKNGRRYTYIVARYKPAIRYNTMENVLKGQFNPQYCKPKPSFSLSDGNQSRFRPKVPSILKGHLLKQLSYAHKKPAIFQRSHTLNRGKINPKETVNHPGGSYDSSYIKYNNGYLKSATKTHPHAQGHLNDKLSYYAGNSWGTNTDKRLSTTATEYFPKQAEVLEEFIEGDDPDKEKYYQGNGKNGTVESMRHSLIPVMNSEDAEIDDEPSEEEQSTKTFTPKYS